LKKLKELEDEQVRLAMKLQEKESMSKVEVTVA
jgi:hypothetical protein